MDKHHQHILSFITTSFRKFCWAVSEELRWQEKQDWRTDLLTNRQTDWLTDGSKTLYPPQLVARGIIILSGHHIYVWTTWNKLKNGNIIQFGPIFDPDVRFILHLINVDVWTNALCFNISCKRWTWVWNWKSLMTFFMCTEKI